MTAGELNFADLELDQETFVALLRILAEAAVHRTLTLYHEDLDNDLGVDPDSSSEDKPPIPTNQASSAMSAAGLGGNATTELSSPKSGRRSLHKPKLGSKKKRQKTRPV
ncbi:hypothetical protein GQ600_25804 [Phytophthora cactorum]|nr:hypothetical protein GQ600_25804 [Phytophthora cactorum]